MTTLSIRLSADRPVTTGMLVPVRAMWARVTRWWVSTWCLLNGGHYKVLHTAPQRVALRCVACGHTSRGWEVGTPRFARTLPGIPERLRAQRVA